MKKAAVIRAFIAIALVFAAQFAEAAITCTASSSGFATAYVPTNPTNVNSSSVTITCQRNAGGDGTTANYLIAANNGLNVSAGSNRARLNATTSYIRYDLYRDAACTLAWAGGGNRITGSITGLTGFTPKSVVVQWWACVPGSQTGLAAGTYNDTVTMTPTPGGVTSTFPVTITNPASCSVTTSPGTITLDYTALGSAVSVNKPFAVSCTNLLPYALSLSANDGVVVGIQYTLALSNTTGLVGTGIPQNYTVTAAAVAGQAGTCSAANCSGTQTRTLIVTY